MEYSRRSLPGFYECSSSPPLIIEYSSRFESLVVMGHGGVVGRLIMVGG